LLFITPIEKLICWLTHYAFKTKEKIMTKDYVGVTGELVKNVEELSKALPDIMPDFFKIIDRAGKDGALTKQTKELIGIAIAVVVGCEGCIGVHSQKLVKLGVTRNELVEALGMAICMGGGPAVMRSGEALKAFDSFSA